VRVFKTRAVAPLAPVLCSARFALRARGAVPLLIAFIACGVARSRPASADSPASAIAEFAPLAEGANVPHAAGMLTGGAGVSWIDGRAYYDIELRPEFSLGRIGAGLDLDFLVDSKTGTVRRADLSTAKLIRYVRYGSPRDPYYGRVGALDGVTLGHGFIVDHYRNQLVENRRKMGLTLAVNQPTWQVQLLTSNLARGDLTGGRVAVAPLAGRVPVPLVSRLRFGGTFATERDEGEGHVGGQQSISAVGADVELPLAEASAFQSRIYFDWARLVDHGAGRALGISAEADHLIGLTMGARLERRWSGAHFVPRYFDFAYEVNRYDPGTGRTLRQTLDSIPARDDVLGELTASFAGLVDIIGGYEVPDTRPRLGQLQFAGSLLPLKKTIDRGSPCTAGIPSTGGFTSGSSTSGPTSGSRLNSATARSAR